EAAVAHCQLIVVSKFIEKLQQDIAGKGVKEQLQLLCGIYALSLIHKHQGDFLSTGSITAKQASLVNDQLRSYNAQSAELIAMKEIIAGETWLHLARYHVKRIHV
ncbi:Acyl-coenzyme a oxidase, partial [Thalictrum thalictroides]